MYLIAIYLTCKFRGNISFVMQIFSKTKIPRVENDTVSITLSDSEFYNEFESSDILHSRN